MSIISGHRGKNVGHCNRGGFTHTLEIVVVLVVVVVAVVVVVVVIAVSATATGGSLNVWRVK